MKSRTIEVNGVEVTVFDNGDVGRLDMRNGGLLLSSGSLNPRGYKTIKFNGKQYLVHRIIAMALLVDYSEEMQVDHINGDKKDNRKENLRMATNRENNMAFKTKTRGASSRYRGVYLDKERGKWMAQIKVGGKPRKIGRFDIEEDAAIARDAVAIAEGFLPESLNFPDRCD